MDGIFLWVYSVRDEAVDRWEVIKMKQTPYTPHIRDIEIKAGNKTLEHCTFEQTEWCFVLVLSVAFSTR